MPKKLKIGIVGCGAIGTSLAKAVLKHFCAEAKLSSFFDIDSDKAKGLAKICRIKSSIVAGSLDSLIKSSDLVIEAAQIKSCWEIARRSLSQGRDIIILSVGGVVNKVKELTEIARKNNAKIYIPSGAVCGIDGLKAASLGRIKKVILTTRKNPASFEGVDYIRRKKINLDKIKKDTVLFSGNALGAIKAFPKNINVAATLSIAGIGAVKTKVRIIASPGVKRNIHEIYIESDTGVLTSRVQNLIHPSNPKTSFLAVLSATAMLKQILEPVRIGI